MLVGVSESPRDQISDHDTWELISYLRHEHGDKTTKKVGPGTKGGFGSWLVSTFSTKMVYSAGEYTCLCLPPRCPSFLRCGGGCSGPLRSYMIRLCPHPESKNLPYPGALSLCKPYRTCIISSRLDSRLYTH